MARPIVFTRHAEFKLALLRRHGFHIARAEIGRAVEQPERLLAGYLGRKIAERSLTSEHSLRVVFEESRGAVKIVTLYPIRKDRCK